MQTESRSLPSAPPSAQLLPSEVLSDLGRIITHDARVRLIRDNALEGRRVLKIDFDRGEHPSIAFQLSRSGEPPSDWSAYGALGLDLTNPSDRETLFVIRIDDDPQADDAHHSRIGRGTIGPQESQTVSIPLGGSDPMEHGMRGGPPTPGVQPVQGITGSGIDPRHIAGFQIALPQPTAPSTLLLNGVRLLPPPSYGAIVDKFGQYTRADWPGKLKDEQEFGRRRAEEEASIRSTNALPNLPDRDAYGGWASGPTLEASGFFRTVQRDGKWWLVDPTGHLFFSLGMDVINVQEGYTVVEGREEMFTWLPERDHPLAKHYGFAERIIRGPTKKGRTFNFYTANLERKYGADYLDAWRAMAVDRLRAWGFNTIGNWSDPKLYDLKRVPYTATIGVHGDFARVSSGLDYWGKMPDPFDPKFDIAADQTIRPIAERHHDDPWCVGYFVDNEISWTGGGGDRGHYGLAYGALSGTASSPAKQAFVEQLKHGYGEIKNLNAAWSTSFPSWEALLDQPFQPPDTPNAAMKVDFSSFLRAFARRYFRVVRDTLKKYDSNHLYLGCRFAWRTQEAVEASAEFCDVVSFNIYDRRLDAQKWDFASKLHKPCLIGEFHFGALDRGMFHPGLVAARDQKDRARMYRDYVESVANHPAFVGCHWFEYVDEPLTGRAFDGENYNIGFVNVTDTPYPEMVAAAKASHQEVYSRRGSK